MYFVKVEIAAEPYADVRTGLFDSAVNACEAVFELAAVRGWYVTPDVEILERLGAIKGYTRESTMQFSIERVGHSYTLLSGAETRRMRQGAGNLVRLDCPAGARAHRLFELATVEEYGPRGSNWEMDWLRIRFLDGEVVQVFRYEVTPVTAQR